MIGRKWEESHYQVLITEDAEMQIVEDTTDYKDAEEEYINAVSFFQDIGSDHEVTVEFVETVYECTVPADEDNNHMEVVAVKILNSWKRTG